MLAYHQHESKIVVLYNTHTLEKTCVPTNLPLQPRKGQNTSLCRSAIHDLSHGHSSLEDLPQSRPQQRSRNHRCVPRRLRGTPCLRSPPAKFIVSGSMNQSPGLLEGCVDRSGDRESHYLASRLGTGAPWREWPASFAAAKATHNSI